MGWYALLKVDNIYNQQHHPRYRREDGEECDLAEASRYSDRESARAAIPVSEKEKWDVQYQPELPVPSARDEARRSVRLPIDEPGAENSSEED